MSTATDPNVRTLVRPSDGAQVRIDRRAGTPIAWMPDGTSLSGEAAVSRLERECETDAQRKARIRAEEEDRAARVAQAKAERRAKRQARDAWPSRRQELEREMADAQRDLKRALADSPAFVAFARWRAAARTLNSEGAAHGSGAGVPVPEFGDAVDRLLDRLPTSEA